jgi:uncharacterized protein with HEPN domain
VPTGKRGLHPDIPCPEIVGLRNRLIHGYDSVDFDILWQIVSDDLPPLIAALEKALQA